MSLSNLEDLFLQELKDTYDAEKRLTKALPKMAKAATSPELQKAFKKHLSETETHVARLERIFKSLDQPARGKKCLAMTGLIEEGSELIGEDASDATLDAGLIGAAQKVEHYEIAAYGTMATYANLLGLADAEKLLKQTLAEEKATDAALSDLASHINFESEQEDDEDEKMPAKKAAKGKRSAGSRKSAKNGKSGSNGKLLGRMGKAISNFVGR